LGEQQPADQRYSQRRRRATYGNEANARDGARFCGWIACVEKIGREAEDAGQAGAAISVEAQETIFDRAEGARGDACLQRDLHQRQATAAAHYSDVEH